MTAKPKPTRRLAAVLLLALLGLAILEGALQLASYVAFRTHSRDEVVVGSSGGLTLLCLGDSYTYGVGASSPETTYPAAMGRAYEERAGVRPTVVNAGWPGLNSRDVLSQIEGQLERHRPDVVLILVGLNDGWSRPDPLNLAREPATSEGAPVSQWRWRFRTWRLVLWLLGRADPAAEAAPPHAPEVPSAPLSGDEFQRAVQLLSRGEYESAAAGFRNSLASQPEHAAEARQGLVQTYTILGEEEKARESLAWLEKDFEARGSLQTTCALAASLAIVRDHARSFEVAKTGAEKFPESSELWWFQGEELHRRGDLRGAEAAYGRALDHAGSDQVAWKAIVMRDLAQVVAPRDPKRALKRVLEALALDGNSGTSLVALEAGKEFFTAELGRQCLSEMDLNPDARRMAETLLDTWFSRTDSPEAGDSVERVLETHLRQMVARCKAHGARVVLLTYPMRVANVEAAVERLASEGGVTQVRTRPLLEQAARKDPNAVLFVPDGHCSDEGYAIMGRAVAAALDRG